MTNLTLWFLVTCYATLHPAMSVGRSVGRLVRPHFPHRFHIRRHTPLTWHTLFPNHFHVLKHTSHDSLPFHTAFLYEDTPSHGTLRFHTNFPAMTYCPHMTHSLSISHSSTKTLPPHNTLPFHTAFTCDQGRGEKWRPPSPSSRATPFSLLCH